MSADHPSPIRFQRPALPSATHVEAYLSASREARWLSNGGPCWQLLRDRLETRVGAACVPVASGTVGLMAVVAALHAQTPGRPHARTALLPSFTFPATAQAARWAGLAPRLLDVDPRHWHLCPDQLERELDTHADEVACVLAVSAFGTPPPPSVRERWQAACRRAGVPLVVDSAAGFGAVAADGVPIGRQGDAEIVSFHATKPFAVGEGGAVFTRDAALCAHIELAVNFGLDADRSAQLPLALNGKMSELHAATALAVLDDFDAVLATRRAHAGALRHAADPALAWQTECERSAWQFVPVAYPDAAERAAAVQRAQDCVETRSYYLPLHRMPAFRDATVADGGVAVTESLAERMLCLPMANDLDADELLAIAAIVTASERAPSLAPQAS